jgi:tetratricopeptide repeat protein
MKTFQTKLGADHPSTLTSMANLASTYRHQGRWEEAEKLEIQVMETRKTKLGADCRLFSKYAMSVYFWSSSKFLCVGKTNISQSMTVFKLYSYLILAHYSK